MGNIKGSISSRNTQKCHLNSLWYYTAQPLKFHKSSHCTLIVSHFTKKFKFTATTHDGTTKHAHMLVYSLGATGKLAKLDVDNLQSIPGLRTRQYSTVCCFHWTLKIRTYRNSFYYVIIHSFSFIQTKLHEGVMVQVQRKQFLLLTCVHI